MKLLDQKTTKQKKDKQAEETQGRITKLNNEENKSANSLNRTKINAGKSMDLIGSNLAEYEVLVAERKDALKGEVDSLENRKKDALKPIKAQKKEAENRMTEAESKEVEVKKAGVAVGKREDEVIERLESISDTEQEIKEKHEEVDKRERGVEAQEESNRGSTDKLNQSWADFHTRVNEANADLDGREKSVEGQKKTNEHFEESLNKKSLRLSERKRQLLDERGTLDRAWAELGKRKKNNGRRKAR